MTVFTTRRAARWAMLACACLLVGACQDRRDPVKPSVEPGGSQWAGGPMHR